MPIRLPLHPLEGGIEEALPPQEIQTPPPPPQHRHHHLLPTEQLDVLWTASPRVDLRSYQPTQINLHPRADHIDL